MRDSGNSELWWSLEWSLQQSEGQVNQIDAIYALTVDEVERKMEQ